MKCIPNQKQNYTTPTILFLTSFVLRFVLFSSTTSFVSLIHVLFPLYLLTSSSLSLSSHINLLHSYTLQHDDPSFHNCDNSHQTFSSPCSTLLSLLLGLEPFSLLVLQMEQPFHCPLLLLMLLPERLELHRLSCQKW